MKMRKRKAIRKQQEAGSKWGLIDSWGDERVRWQEG